MSNGISRGERIANLYGVRHIKAGSGGAFFFASMILYFLDFGVILLPNIWPGFGFTGIDFKSFLNIFYQPNWWYIFTNIGAWAALIVLTIILKKRHKDFDAKEVISWFALFWFVYFIVYFSDKNTGLMLHLTFALFVRFTFFNTMEDKAQANWLIILLIGIDFFSTSLIRYYLNIAGLVALKPALLPLANRILFPVWPIVAIIHWVNQEDRSAWSNLFLFFLLVLLLGTFIDVKKAYGKLITDEATQRDIMEAEQGIRGVWQRFVDSVTQSWKRSIKTATGGDYYTGQVDANAKVELGVFLEDARAASEKFYEDEKVIVWATLIGKTLDKPVSVYLECKSGEMASTEIQPNTIENPIDIAKEEQVDINCIFNPGRLKPGSQSVTLNANFDFETLAYLKTYFIDQDRLRSMRRENIDVFEQYGITDTNPIAISTKGPVVIGMETNEPIIGLGTESLVKPMLGVTLDNQWDGKILSITELVIEVPNTMELIACDHEVEQTQSEDTGYSAYKLTNYALRRVKTPIKSFQSFRCFVNIKDKNAILGTTPVATHYFRAKAKYIYQIEEEVHVNIIGGDGIKTNLFECDTICGDEDGCICPAGCKEDYGFVIEKDSQCGALVFKVLEWPLAKSKDRNVKMCFDGTKVIIESDSQEDNVISIADGTVLTGGVEQERAPNIVAAAIISGSGSANRVQVKHGQNFLAYYGIPESSSASFDSSYVYNNKRLTRGDIIAKIKTDTGKAELDFRISDSIGDSTRIVDPLSYYNLGGLNILDENCNLFITECSKACEYKECICKANDCRKGKNTIINQFETCGGKADITRECQSKNDGDKCEDDLYKFCKDGDCITKCWYYRGKSYKDVQIGDNWDCICTLDECNKLLSSNQCAKELCPGKNYCCLPQQWP